MRGGFKKKNPPKNSRMPEIPLPKVQKSIEMRIVLV